MQKSLLYDFPLCINYLHEKLAENLAKIVAHLQWKKTGSTPSDFGKVIKIRNAYTKQIKKIKIFLFTSVMIGYKIRLIGILPEGGIYEENQER